MAPGAGGGQNPGDAWGESAPSLWKQLGSADCRQKATYFFLPTAIFTHFVGSSFQTLSEISGQQIPQLFSFSWVGKKKKNLSWADMETLIPGPIEIFPPWRGPA